MNFCGENGAVTPLLRYKIILEHKQKNLTEFLKGTTHDLLECIIVTKTRELSENSYPNFFQAVFHSNLVHLWPDTLTDSR